MPHLERSTEGVLNNVFCERDVVDSNEAREHGDRAAGLMPKEMVREFHLHVQDLDWTNFYRTAGFENRATFREFYCVLQIPSLD